jgi:N-acetylglucosamine kinase-like BadF-type ATPase
MKLIADSGSTKTDWVAVNERGTKFTWRSEGINPYFHDAKSVASTLKQIDFSPFTHQDFTEVDFYSAGTNTSQNVRIMNQGFKGVFTNAKVNIAHDLLGAARALFEDEDGIAGILGTGSNSCLFINGKIVSNLGGQGYILGDEGSGMHIGRKVVRDFMNDLMPKDILQAFIDHYGLTKDQITFAVYKKVFPNRFLAGFSKFVYDHKDHEYCQALLDDAFTKYFERYIIQYPDYQKYRLRIVGSVGYFFQDLIKEKAQHYGIEFDKVIQGPIDGLLKYHTTH